jgi:archaellum component FlaC
MTRKAKSQLHPKVKQLFTGTEVGALLEDIDHKLGSVIDGQKGLGERMDTLEGGMNGLEKRMTRLEVKVDTVGVNGRHSRSQGRQSHRDRRRHENRTL